MDLASASCAWCHQTFTPAVHNQIRCSHRCTRRAAKQRESVRRRGEIPTSKSCAWCGKTFKPFSIKTRMCSPQCRMRVKDARRAHRWQIKRSEIFERDGWRCRLCSDPIDPKIPYPNPRAATIDHIIPISRGGSDDPSNLQAAHMACNSAKGDALWT